MKTPWVFLVALLLMLYSTGTTFIESFVNYPSWRLIGQTEFLAYHRFIGPRVIALLVVPGVLAAVFNVLMFWFRPKAMIPLWMVVATVALQVIVWASSALVHIPIQLQLGKNGKSIELIDRLITTNLVFRRVPHGLCTLLFIWMAARVMRVPANDLPDAPGSGTC